MSRKLTTEEFILKANLKHNNAYDYSNTHYVNSKTKICITCPIHGEFYQMPYNHLSGQGCPKCKIVLLSKKFQNKQNDIISKFRKIHGDKYDYSKVEYINLTTPIAIICPIHGEFKITPQVHIRGGDCQKCALEQRTKKRKKTKDIFIEQSNNIHNNKYDYSKFVYTNDKTKSTIICPIHGEFEQTPSNHLTGRGCPKCKQSHIENGVERLLIENNIEYIPQKRFNWLRLQSLDFYLQQHHIAIECQGRQHFERIEMFDKRYTLEERIELDYNKQKICLKNGVKILYLVPLNSQLNKKIYNEFNTYYNINQLIEDIKKATYF